MNVREILRRLQEQPFHPFAVVTSDGERHEVRHPENARLLPGGVLYLFSPLQSDEAQVDFPTALSVLHITTLQPLQDSRQATN